MNLIISGIVLLLTYEHSEVSKLIFKDSFDYPSGALPTNDWSEGCPE